MELSLRERMLGTVVDADGGTHVAVLEMRAEADDLTRLVRSGSARVDGVLLMPPWAEDAPLAGSLTVSPFRQRAIHYDLGFAGRDASAYQVVGSKRLGMALRAGGALSCVLRRDAEVMARGELRLDPCPPRRPARSWSLGAGSASVPLDGAGLLPAPGRRLQDVRALAEAMLVAGRHVPAPDEQTVATALQILSTDLSASLRATHRASLGLLDVLALLGAGRRFAALGVGQRRRILELLDRQGGLGRALLMVLGMPVNAAHFSRRDYLSSVGFPSYPEPAREPEPRWMQNHFPPEAMGAEGDLECDVVVVGSGAGGAPVAALLAEKGLAVAVVEEGRYHRRADFAGDPRERVARLWRDRGMTAAYGVPPVPIPVGRMVGGSTAINSGTCMRPPADVLEGWRRDLGFTEQLSAAGLAPFVASVEAELRVARAEARHLGPARELVARGAAALNRPHGPLLRNAPDCDGQGLCAYGCPTDAKRSTNVSYIPRAMRAGAHLFTGLEVQRLLLRGSKVVAVEARGADRQGAPRVLRIKARAVVLACGTLHTPVLLMKNGIDGPLLGRNLSCHPAMGMTAMTDREGAPWQAIPQGYGVDGLLDPRIRFEGLYVPPQIFAAAVPLLGSELTRWMDAQARVVQYGFMVKDPNPGSVRVGLGGRPFIRYDLARESFELFRRGAAVLAELLLRGGASEVLAGLGPIKVVRSVDEARRIADAPLRPHDFRLMGFHPLGTCRMGPDAERGVVDFEHRVFGLDNLYVSDGSVVPTSLGVNPQVTIMSMAERAAHCIAERLA